MLEINGLNVSYGDVQILWDISLRISEGEIVTIVGSNGAGKTTCIKTLSGLIAPSSGTVRFLGDHIQGLSPHRVVELGLLQIPEGRQLWPQMSVHDNLVLGSYSARARKERRKTLEEVFALFPRLKERHKQLAGTLSGGEQQMLAISRGLMACPKLLMLDEPSLGLAPLVIEELFQIIKTINKKGITILLVEQNLHNALEVAHRAYVLETGRIAIEGESCTLLDNEYIKKAYLGL